MPSMISTILKAETAYLATFENRQISIMRKEMVCDEVYREKSELSEIDLVGTLGAENLNSTYSGYAKYDFNGLKG